LNAAGLIVPAESEVMDGPLRVLGIVDPDPFQLKGIRGLNITLREVNELRSHYSVTPALALYSYSTPEAAVKSLKAPLGSAVPMSRNRLPSDFSQREMELKSGKGRSPWDVGLVISTRTKGPSLDTWIEISGTSGAL